MEIISYNAELAIANMLFKHIFSNIKIFRSDRKTGRQTSIHAMCLFELRSRIIKNWENTEKRASYKLPMIIINRTGYSRNPERLNNINNEVKYEITSKNRNENYLTPIPVDISYEVTIMAKYPSDIDLIASNFMVFFNNDIYVHCKHPKYDGIYLNNLVVMEDSITEEHTGEIDSTQDDFITTTFNFVFKTYLFGGTLKSKVVPSKVLSSWISSYMKTEISVVPYDQIDNFLLEYPRKDISAEITHFVTETVTAYVDNPDVSSNVYDGIIPIINTLSLGFYPTPTISDHIEYMNEVDSYPLLEQSSYVDRIDWTILQ